MLLALCIPFLYFKQLFPVHPAALFSSPLLHSLSSLALLLPLFPFPFPSYLSPPLAILRVVSSGKSVRCV